MTTKRETAKRASDIRFTFDYLVKQLGDRELDGVEIGRLQKALPIALSDDPLKKYKTTWTTCECPDQGYRMRFICKHRLALMLRNRPTVVQIVWMGESLYDSVLPAE